MAIGPEEVNEQTVGAVLCQDLVVAGDAGRVKLGKGHIVNPEDVSALRASGRELHLVFMEAGDIHEDEASQRLARAISGPNVSWRDPVESQTHVRASCRGLLEVRSDTLYELNLLPDVGVFSAYNGQPVDRGKAVAATKVTPLVVPEEVIVAAERIAARVGPIVQVHPFMAGSVGVVVRERVAGGQRDRFENSIADKLAWFGSPLAGIEYLPEDVAAIAGALRCFLDRGVSLILAAGVNSTDPLDLTIQALERIGARTEKRGVPAHPGSTCWLSYAGDTPIFGLALCGMFSQTTVLDLLLPRFLSGQSVHASDLAYLGHGGLLNRDMQFRFPDYRSAGSSN